MNKEELEKANEMQALRIKERDELLLKLKNQNAELNSQLSDVHECFISASSGDDFEMAESAREIMEVLNISCYRHGKVKSKLTEAKEIINNLIDTLITINGEQIRNLASVKDAEQFLKE